MLTTRPSDLGFFFFWELPDHIETSANYWGRFRSANYFFSTITPPGYLRDCLPVLQVAAGTTCESQLQDELHLLVRPAACSPSMARNVEQEDVLNESIELWG